MRKIKEILRLKWGLGLSARQVGASLRISHSTVGEYLKRAEQAGMDWAQVESMSEAAIAEQLFPPQKANGERAEPNWAQVDIELQRKGVTRMLLWQEYLEEYPDGYSYSQFCERYRKWQKSAEKTTMRKPKKAGEEVEVDYAGLTVPVTNPKTGETQEMQIFLEECSAIGVLGASGYIYCEAHRSQNLPNWVRAHVHRFEFYCGVPKIVRPDNLKAGVTKPCFYEPDINPTYHELAQHYNLAVIPTLADAILDRLVITPIVLNCKVNLSEKSVLSTPCRPLDVQYVDQFCYSVIVVDYFRNHWSVSPEYAALLSL